MNICLAATAHNPWIVDEYIHSFYSRYMSEVIDTVYRERERESSDSKKKKKEDMQLYLACSSGTGAPQITEESKNCSLNILESFFYIDDVITKYIPYFRNFLLDSGAFTFFSSGAKNIDWNDYLERYVAYINDNDIKHFFELDIDKLVGYDKVLEFRKKLEKLTGKQCIPVWHKSRGKEKFIEMCHEYKYVAIGGIVSNEIKRDEYKYFPYFINAAHKYGAKIHGLGFTNLEGLKKYHFDSVDSTAWTSGSRFGFVYHFNGKTMQKKDVPKGYRLKTIEVARQNFNEWVKFCDYAERNL